MKKLFYLALLLSVFSLILLFILSACTVTTHTYKMSVNHYSTSSTAQTLDEHQNEVGIDLELFAGNYSHSKETYDWWEDESEYEYEDGDGILFGAFYNHGITPSLEIGFAGRFGAFSFTSYADINTTIKYNLIPESIEIFDLTLIGGLDYHVIRTDLSYIDEVSNKIFDPMAGLLIGTSLFNGILNISAGVQNFYSYWYVRPEDQTDEREKYWKYEPYFIANVSVIPMLPIKFTLSFNYNLYGDSRSFEYVNEQEYGPDDRAYIEIKPTKYFLTLGVSFLFNRQNKSEE